MKSPFSFMMLKTSFTLFAFFALHLSVSAQNVDWPQWRGPQRNGIVAGFVAPQVWPKQLTKVWQIEVGEGHASPLAQGKNVYVFSRWQAVQIKHHNGAWSTAPAWRNEEVNLFLNTPVLHEDLLFGFSDRNSGQYFCLVPRTGKLLWTSAGRQAESAITLIADKTLAILTENGELIFAETNPRAYTPLAKYQVAASNTLAHPAFAGQSVLIKDQRLLTLLKLP